MYSLHYLNLCNPFKNRLQNAKDFLSLPVLLKFSLWHCSSESLPVSCLQNIHIQSTISTIAINKEPFMQTCYNFITHTLYRKKVFSFQYQWSTHAMWKECSLSVQRGHDCALCESTVCITEGRTRWPKKSFSSLTSMEVHSMRNCILTTRCRILCGKSRVLPQDVFLIFFPAVKDKKNTFRFVTTIIDKTQKGQCLHLSHLQKPFLKILLTRSTK